MVGCADIVRGYPVDSTAMVGLFLLSEAYQGQGLGTAAYRKLEEILRGWEGCRRVRIGVVTTNARLIGL